MSIRGSITPPIAPTPAIPVGTSTARAAGSADRRFRACVACGDIIADAKPVQVVIPIEDLPRHVVLFAADAMAVVTDAWSNRLADVKVLAVAIRMSNLGAEWNQLAGSNRHVAAKVFAVANRHAVAKAGAAAEVRPAMDPFMTAPLSKVT